MINKHKFYNITLQQLESQKILIYSRFVTHLCLKTNLQKNILNFLHCFFLGIAGSREIWNADSEKKSSFIKYLNPLWVVKSVFHKQLFPDRTDNFSTSVLLRWHLRIYLDYYSSRERKKGIAPSVSLSTVLIVKTHCAKPTKYVFEIELRKKYVLVSTENP